MINAIRNYKYNFDLADSVSVRIDSSQGWRKTALRVALVFAYFADVAANGFFVLAKVAVYLAACCSRPISSEKSTEKRAFSELIEQDNFQGVLKRYTSSECDALFRRECRIKLGREIAEEAIQAEKIRLRLASGAPAFFRRGFSIEGDEGIRLAAQFSLLTREIYRKNTNHLPFSELVNRTGFPVWSTAIPWLANQYYTMFELSQKFEAQFRDLKNSVKRASCQIDQDRLKTELLKQIDPGIYFSEEGRLIADYHFFRIDWIKIRTPFGGDPNLDRTFEIAHPQYGQVTCVFEQNSFSMGRLSTSWSDREDLAKHVQID